MTTNINNLKKIIGVITNHSVSKAKKGEVENRIKTFLTPRLFGDTLISSHSFEGQFTIWLRNQLEVDNDLGRRWNKIFKDSLPYFPQKEVKDLHPDHLNQLKILRASKAPSEFENNSSLETLKTLIKRHEQQIPKASKGDWAHDPQILKGLSLLSQVSTTPNPLINPSILRALILDTSDSSAASFSNSLNYLKPLLKKSEYVDCYEASKILDQAMQLEQKLQRAINDGKDPAKRLEAKNQITALANSTATSIQDLPLRKSLLIFSGCPAQPTKIHLKEDLNKSDWFPHLKKFLEEDKIEEMAHFLMGKFYPVVRDIVSKQAGNYNWDTLKEELNEGFLGYFIPQLKNSLGKKISDHYAHRMSELISEEMSQYFSKETLTVWQQAYETGNLEKELKTFLQEKLKISLKVLRDKNSDLILKVLGNMPPIFSDFLSIYGHADWGQLEQSMWIEIEQESLDNYNLTFHASQSYQFQNLTSKQLTPELFEWIYSRKSIPEWSSNVYYSLENTLNGLQCLLKKEPVVLEDSADTLNGGSYWDILKKFFQKKINFQSAENYNLFIFGLQKQAFLDMWGKVKSNPQRLDHKFLLKKTLLDSAQALARIAYELYNIGCIDFYELKVIYATTWEACEALKTPEPVEENREKSLVPIELKRVLTSLLKGVNLWSPFVIDCIKDWFTGLVGEELEGAVDSLFKEILFDFNVNEPEVESITKAIKKERVWQKWPEVRAAVLVRTIYRVIRVVRQIFLIVTDFVWETVAFVFRKAFIPTVTWIFPGLRKQVFRLAGWSFAHALLKQEHINEIQHLAKTWGKDWLRRANISYEVKSPIPQWQLLKIKRKLPRIVVPAVQFNNTSTIDKTLSSKTVINENNLVEYLKKWKTEADLKTGTLVEQAKAKFFYLNRQIQNLPIPSSDLDDCWNELPPNQVRPCMEMISELIFEFYQHAWEGFPNSSIFERSRFIVNLYSVCAIMDGLARRCPESELEGLKINPWGFALWIKRAPISFLDPAIYKKVKEICSYFKIDLYKDYTEQEILEKGRDSLFFQADNPKNSNLVFYSDLNGSQAENRYYQKLLDNPRLKLDRKFAFHGIFPNAKMIDRVAMLYCDRSLLKSQWKTINPEFSSHLDNNQDPSKLFDPNDPRKGLLPRPVYLLRFWNLLCNETVTCQGQKKSWGPSKLGFNTINDWNISVKRNSTLRKFTTCKWEDNEKTNSPFRGLPYAYSIITEENSSLVSTTSRSKILLMANQESSDWEERIPVADKEKYKNVIQVINDLLNRTRNQNDIVNDPSTFQEPKTAQNTNFFSSLFNKITPWKKSKEEIQSTSNISNPLKNLEIEKRKLLEMVWTNKSDQVIEVLSFFTKNIHLFGTPNKEFLFIFDLLLLQGGLLHDQLETYPNFANTVGTFFKKAFEVYPSTMYPEIALELTRIGIMAQEICDHYPNSHTFPPFRDLILSQDKWPESFKSKRILVLLMAYVCTDPNKVSKEKALQIIDDLCLSQILTAHDNTDPLHKIQRELWLIWKPKIAEALNRNVEFRSKVLNRVVVFQGSLKKLEGDWEGEFPHFRSIDGYCSFTDQNAQMNFSHEVQRNKILKRLKTIVGIPCDDLRHEGHGIYRVPSQDIGIEIKNYKSKKNSFTQQLQIYKMHQGVKCILVKPLDVQGETPPQPGITRSYWFKDVPGIEPMILMLENGKLVNSIYIQKGDQLVPNDWDFQEVLMRPLNVLNEGSVEQVDLSKAKHDLGPLTRFEDISEIHCIRHLSKPEEVHSISILGMLFIIKEIKGQKEAVNADGFFIDRTQKDPSLGLYSNYLLLKNERGDRRVILRPKTLLGAYSSALLKQSSLVTPSLISESFLTKLMKPLLEGTIPFNKDYFVFDLDKSGQLINDSSEGSDSAEGIALLFCYHLLFKHKKQTEFYFKRFQALATREALTEHIHSLFLQIECFSMLVDDPEMILYSLRVRAIREENNLIPLKGKSKKKVNGGNNSTNDKDQWFASISWIIAQNNLQNYLQNSKGYPRPGLNEFEQIFILKGIADQSQKILKAGFVQGLDLRSLSSYFLNGSRLPIPNFLLSTLDFSLKQMPEEMIMMPDLAGRYAFLLKKYSCQVGPKGNILKRVQQFIIAAHEKKNNHSKILTNGSTTVTKSEGNFITRQFADWLSKNRSLLREDKDYLSRFKTMMSERDPKSHWETVPVTYKEITNQDLKKSFLVYYRFVLEECPEDIVDDPDQIEKFNEKAKQFKETLVLMDGRHFDSYIVFLMAWLNAARIGTSFADFPKASSFEKIFDKFKMPLVEELEKELLELASDFKHACLRHLILPKKNITKALSIFKAIGKPYMPYYVADKAANVFKNFPKVVSLLREASWDYSFYSYFKLFYPYVRTISKYGFGLYKKHHFISQSRASLKEHHVTDASIPDAWKEAFKSDDHILGLSLKELHEQHFLPTSQKLNGIDPNSSHVKPYETPVDNPLLKFYFDRLNKSMKDFAARVKEVTYNYTLKDFFTLHSHITSLHDELELHLSQEENNIIAFAQSPNMTYQTDSETLNDLVNSRLENNAKLTMDDLLENFLQENNARLRKIPGLTPDREKQLEFMIFRYLLKKSRHQQMQRCIGICEKLLEQEIDLTQPEVKKNIDDLSYELTRKRAYSIDQVSRRFLKTYLLFEVKTKKMLWEIQVTPVQEMLVHKYLRAVVEMIMGIGKTFWAIPGISQLAATSQNIIFIIWTKALKRSQSSETSERSKDAFFQDSNTINIRRRTVLGENELWGILQMFQRAIIYREPINATKEDMQSIECRFIEALEKKFANEKDAPSDEILFYYMAILSLIDKIGKANIDEVHEILKRIRELNFPLGKQRQAEKSWIRILKKCTSFLRNHPNKSLLGLENNLQSCVPEEEYHEKIKPKLVEDFCNYKKFNITEEQKPEFRAYLSDSKSAVPDFVLNSPLRAEMGMARGALNKILPKTLKKIIDVDFGPSDREYAGPYRGNKKAIKSSTIRNPFEAILKTFIMTQLHRLTQDQGQQFIKELIERAKIQSKRDNIALSQTSAAKNFDKWTKNCGIPRLHELINEFGISDICEDRFTRLITKTIDVLNKSDEAVLVYTEIVIAPQIMYYDRNIRHNSQNFVSMFHSFYSDTGTAHNLDSFPVGTVPILTPGTSGETISNLRKKCKKILELESQTPQGSFSEILNFFQKDKKMRAIIDTGALFRGISSTQVAENLLNYISTDRADIGGIVFFDENENKMVWEKNATQPKLLSDSSLKPDQLITFYDHAHTIGADIDQDPNAHAILTIGEDITLEKLEQGASRMRLFNKGKQKIIPVMNRRVRHLISGKNNPTIDDIIIFATKNEATELGEDSFFTDQHQIGNVTFRNSMKKLIRASNIKDLMNLYAQYRKVLIVDVENDPFLLYGQQEREADPEEALTIYKDLNLSQVPSKEKAILRTEMNSIGKNSVHPNKVLIPSNPTSLYKNLDTAMGVEQTVEQNAEQEHENNNEIQNQLQNELQQELHQENEHERRIPLKYRSQPAAWYNHIDYFNSLDWLKLKDNHQNESITIQELSHSMSLSTQEAIREVSPAYANNKMYCTNNFIGIVQAARFPLAEIANRRQKPVLQLLVVQTKKKRQPPQIHTIALDQSDIAFWKKMLADNRNSRVIKNPEIKIALYDLSLGAITLTGANEITETELEQNDNFNKSIDLWKWFNGETEYTAEELERLKKWRGKFHPNGKDITRAAFEVFLQIRRKRNIHGTDVAILLSTDDEDFE